MIRPHYVSTDGGQIRLWLNDAAGGPPIVVVAGPTRAAETVLSELGEVFPDRQIVVVEPPGIGGSARALPALIDRAAETVVDALEFLGETTVDLVGLELSNALLPVTGARLSVRRIVAVDMAAATAWCDAGLQPPPCVSQDDGTHLNALWVFLRDRRLLRPADPTLPIADGPPLPSVSELDATFLAAVSDPVEFRRWWHLAAQGLPAAVSMAQADGVAQVRTLAELADVLQPADASDGPLTPLPTAPRPWPEVWYEYVETAVGRVHVRRAGASGRPVLVLSTGGGSSAQFTPVVQGLGETRTAVAMDYLGNGLSTTPDRVPDIGTLAEDALAVADALGWDTFDVWGSHTGACVALEMMIMAPERVGRGVFEAPVIVPPEFRDDLLAHYFPDFTPDGFGLHLQHVWHWRRDQFSYWPWYRVEHAAVRGIGVPSAEDLQDSVLGILQSGTSYDLAYRAAFSYDTASRLPLLRRPAILTAGPHDMLANALDDAAELAPEGMLDIVATPETVWWPDADPDGAAATMRIYRDFLG